MTKAGKRPIKAAKETRGTVSKVAAAMREYDRRCAEANNTPHGADYNALVSEVAEEFGLHPATFARFVQQNTFTKPN